MFLKKTPSIASRPLPKDIVHDEAQFLIVVDLPGSAAGENCSNKKTALGLNNQGRFLVFHRDHGDITLWGDPYYTVSNINGLTNGDLLPVVFWHCPCIVVRRRDGTPPGPVPGIGCRPHCA